MKKKREFTVHPPLVAKITVEKYQKNVTSGINASLGKSKNPHQKQLAERILAQEKLAERIKHLIPELKKIREEALRLNCSFTLKVATWGGSNGAFGDEEPELECNLLPQDAVLINVNEYLN